jgi:hypothetical protein
MMGDTRRCIPGTATTGVIDATLELVTDPTFTNSANVSLWAVQDANVTRSISSGALTVTTNASASSDSVYYALATEPGVEYTVTASCTPGSGATGGYLQPRDQTNGGTNITSTGNNIPGSGSTTPTITFTAVSGLTMLRVGTVKTGNASTNSWTLVSTKSTGRILERSYKAAMIKQFGTIARTAVAAAAALVTWGPFSSANYLQEQAYSADLDPGTGQIYVPFWGTLPTTLPVSSFPVEGADVLGIGDFSSSVGWTQGAGVNISGGVATYSSVASGVGLTSQNMTVVPGKVYLVTFTVSSYVSDNVSFRIGGTGNFYRAAALGNGTFQVFVPAAGAGTSQALFMGATGGGANYVLDNVTVQPVGIACAFDRSAATGAYYRVGANGIGQLVAECYDGTTTRTVITTASYNTNTIFRAALAYDGAGNLSIYVGSAVANTTSGASLLTLNNPSAIATYGNRRDTTAPWPGTLVLTRVGLTAPSTAAAKFMFDTEREMMNNGAQILLADVGAVLDFSYDDMEKKLKVVTAANEASFIGLVRSNTAGVPYGTFSKAGMRGGVKLLARASTTPGIDVSIPAYGLREEMYNRAERAAALSRIPQIFDFDATSSQQDFALPAGYVVQEVIAARNSQREGSTKDWIRNFDGFVETAHFNTGQALNTWVQLIARRA